MLAMGTCIDEQSSECLPVGYRFAPTDEELVYYLSRKVIGEHPVSSIINDIDAVDYYSRPPSKHDIDLKEKEYFLFILHNKNFTKEYADIRIVENGKGFWKISEEEKSVPNLDEKSMAVKKTILTYYTGRAPKGKKTHWTMEEYRLDERYGVKFSGISETKMEQWMILGRIKRGKNYDDKLTKGAPQ